MSGNKEEKMETRAKKAEGLFLFFSREKAFEPPSHMKISGRLIKAETNVHVKEGSVKYLLSR